MLHGLALRALVLAYSCIYVYRCSGVEKLAQRILNEGENTFAQNFFAIGTNFCNAHIHTLSLSLSLSLLYVCASNLFDKNTSYHCIFFRTSLLKKERYTEQKTHKNSDNFDIRIIYQLGKVT